MSRVSPPLMSALLCGVLCVARALADSGAAQLPPAIWTETDTSRISMAGGVGGRLTVGRCATCAPLQLTITAQTVFQIDTRSVTQAEWQTFVAKGGGYGADVAYVADDKSVVLVRALSVAPLNPAHR